MFVRRYFIEFLTNIVCLILVNRIIIGVLTNLMHLIVLNRILRIPLGLDRIKC